MATFNFKDEDSLGQIISVDSSVIIVRADDLEQLKRVQVNRLMAIQSSKANKYQIGIVFRVVRKPLGYEGGLENENKDDVSYVDRPENNLIYLNLIGTLHDKNIEKSIKFHRTIETMPEIETQNALR